MTDSGRELEPASVERLAVSAYLLGKHQECVGLWARAHQLYLERDLPEAAARCAFWLAYGLLDRGESAQASGWLARARRLVPEGSRDCVEQGYLLLPLGIEAIGRGPVGLEDGTDENARFNRLQGLAFDGRHLYVADAENHALRRVDLEAKSV